MIHKSTKLPLIRECYEYLYVDDYALFPQKSKQEEDEEERGVIIIELMNHD